jgi:hypothetical protein
MICSLYRTLPLLLSHQYRIERRTFRLSPFFLQPAFDAASLP